MSDERYEAGWASLVWMRGERADDISSARVAEFEEIRQSIREEVLAQQGRRLQDVVLERANRSRLPLSRFTFLGQQGTGSTAFAYFAPQFFALVVRPRATSCSSRASSASSNSSRRRSSKS